ncbi:MAG: UDP-3-O-(3-hydroxymyristoyl)glucosamine N-acyltransferase [Bacteroidota bacterium]
MKFTSPQKLSDIASLLNTEFIGNAGIQVFGINEMNVVQEGDIVFVDHPKYYDEALHSKASVIIINKKVECPLGKALIFSSDPFRDFNKITSHFFPRSFSEKQISDSAVIGKNTTIMSNVFIGDNVKIGNNCIIYPNVVIYYNCIIGDNVIIHANTVIGADAFYYKKRPTGYDRLFSCGKVVIEDDVEIGALSSIDRGVTDETVIGKGTKIDNHVQIGHDTKIGKNCLFISQVGISGAVVIEDDVILWGQVGVPSKIRIGKGAVLLGQSAPIKDLEGGKTYLGSPADESMKKFRELVMIKKLPKIIEMIEH